MSKTRFILLSMICLWLLFCMGTLVGCDLEIYNNDWSYDLPNGYTIWRINSKEIKFGKKTSEYSMHTIVGGYISQFCYNNQYVLLQCLEYDITSETIQNADKSDLRFYIVDLITEDVKGPLSEDDFNELLIHMKIENLSTWIQTSPRPDGATIP